MPQLMTWKFCEYKVFVYRNLHQKCWSIKSLYGMHYGRVILHCTSVDLNGASFKVNDKGRLRVLTERSKNVHAGVVGYLSAAHVITERYDMTPQHRITDSATSFPKPDGDAWRGVTYNPYKYSTFVFVDDLSVARGKNFDVALCDDMSVVARDMLTRINHPG